MEDWAVRSTKLSCTVWLKNVVYSYVILFVKATAYRLYKENCFLLLAPTDKNIKCIQSEMCRNRFLIKYNNNSTPLPFMKPNLVHKRILLLIFPVNTEARNWLSEYVRKIENLTLIRKYCFLNCEIFILDYCDNTMTSFLYFSDWGILLTSPWWLCTSIATGFYLTYKQSNDLWLHA